MENQKTPRYILHTQYLHKKLNNFDVTAEIIESRLLLLVKKSNTKNKLTNGKSYFIED